MAYWFFVWVILNEVCWNFYCKIERNIPFGDFLKILTYFRIILKIALFKMERKGSVLPSVESSDYYLMDMFEGKTLQESIGIKDK